MKKNLVLNAAIIGIMAAGSMGSVFAADGAKTSDEGLCSGASACKGHGGCGAVKGKNGCKGQGASVMSKEACEKLAKKEPKAKHVWSELPAPAKN